MNLRTLAQLIGVAGTILSTPVSTLCAQVDSGVVRVVSRLRTSGEPSGAEAILTQRREARSQRALDALGDSLVAIATSKAGYGSNNSRSRITAVTELMAAGKGRDGVPYDRAAACLLKIALDTTANGVQTGAAYALTSLPDRAKSIRHLAEISQSLSRAAVDAVGYLHSNMGVDGNVRLRLLYSQGAVRESLARKTLEAIAKESGWR